MNYRPSFWYRKYRVKPAFPAGPHSVSPHVAKTAKIKPTFQ